MTGSVFTIYIDKHKGARTVQSSSQAITNKCTREGNMDTRSDTGFGYSVSKWIESFWIGVVESVKKFKSVESVFGGEESTKTFLTGRPGMSIPRKEGLALTRVRLGRH